MARRKSAAVKGPAQDPREQQQKGTATEPPQEKQQQQQQTTTSSSSLSSTYSWYYPRQYGGLSLGAAACMGTMLMYDQEDPLRVWKTVAWLMLALIGLLVHELRPFKRMNYGDLQRQE